MKKLLYALVATLLVQLSFAAFTPYTPEQAAAKPAPLNATISAEACEKAMDKKLTRLQKWKLKLLQKRTMRGQAGIFPYREELTEGFQALPFFGTILTAGLVALVMLFTAKDRNAMRWAGYGISVLSIIITVATLVVGLSVY